MHYSHLTQAQTYNLSATPGVLSQIIVNGGTTGTITVYDGPVAAGNIVATITAAVGMVVPYLCRLDKGLTVVQSAATDTTVVFSNTVYR